MASDFDREGLRPAGQRAIDLFVENFDGPPASRVDPGCTRAAVRELFAGTIPEEGVGFEQAVEDFERLVLPNSMRTPHPLYLGLVNTSPLPGGTLGDLLVSLLNNNGGAFHQGPALAAAEDEVIRAFGRLFGIEAAQGMFLPGGSYANLHGLLLARAAHFPEWKRNGPTALEGAPVVYTSDVAHFSVRRAARVAGIGEREIVAIPSVGRGAMDVNALARRIAADRAAGKRPFVVCATIGTTGAGAIDPIGALGRLCRDEGLWLHVDACYGGGALLLEDRHPNIEGVELADSIVVDPHKWFYMPMTAAIVLTRHAELERETFDTDATYIPDDGCVDPYRRGIPTSRRCAGGMVWFALRAHGWNTIRTSVRRNVALTRLLERLLEERGFAVLPDGELSIACARWAPRGWTPERADRLQLEIADAVVKAGTAWFATVQHAGRTWLRFNILNLHTREAHLRTLIEALAAAVARIA